MIKRTSRRQLLKALAGATGVAGLCKVLGIPLMRGIAQELELDEYVHLPLITTSDADTPTETPTPTDIPTATPTSTPTATATATATNTPTATATSTPTSAPTGSRVVHVHSDEATYWDFGHDYYGDFVNQDVVDCMVDRGVMELTGAGSVAQAWQMLVPDYIPGKGIAVKVNFNNCFWCDTTSDRIDGLIHPINAVARGLLQAYPSFDTADVWIYDATIGKDPPASQRQIPRRFKDGCLDAGVRFFDQGCNDTAGYTSSDPTATITWANPTGIPVPPEMRVTDVLVNAAYVINIPIMKRHLGGVTLSFKNHLGSIANPAPLHDWIFNSGAHYSGTTYNPMIDINRNPHVLGKTVLTLGDGLFGNYKDNVGKPSPWTSFGGSAPNSLLFATDPVALDCVMCDFLDRERAIQGASDDYLVYAATLGLGTFERGDPWGSGYRQIDYQKIEL